MADKTLKIGTTLEPMPAPGMERMLKKHADLVAKANNFDATIKGLDKTIKKNKEFAKVMQDFTNKQLKEKDRLLETINKKTQKSIELTTKQGELEIRAYRLARAQMASAGIDPNSPMYGRVMEARMATNVGRFQTRAMGDIVAGGQFQAGQDQLSQDAQSSITAQRQQRLMQASVWLQAAGGVAGIVSEAYTAPMKKLANQASQAAFAGQLYNEISNADYSGLRAFSNAGPGEIAKLAGYASASKGWGMASGVVGGLGQIAGGAGLVVGGLGGEVPTGGMSSMAVPYGASTMVSGASSVFRAGEGLYTEEQGAAAAQAAREGLSLYKALDPVGQLQYEKLASRSRMMQELGSMAGGIGTKAWKELQRNTYYGGLTDQEAMPYFMQLRAGIGQRGAEDLIGTASRSSRLYGMERGAATTALIGLSGMQGGSPQAEARLEQILHRAFAAGLKDTAVQSALATSLPGLMTGAGGRGSGIGAAGPVSAAAMAAGGDMAGMNIALQGLSQQNALFGTGSPINALATAQAGNIASVAAKHGLSTVVQQALVTIGDPMQIGTAGPGSKIWGMLAKEGKTPEEIRQILGEIRTGAFGTTMSFAGAGMNANPDARDIVLTGGVGGTGETVGAAFSIAGSRLGGDISGPYRITNTADQEALNHTNQINAVNQMLPILQALQDPKAAENLSKLAAAGTMVSEAFAGISKMDPAALRDLPDILGDVAGALAKLKIAGLSALGRPAPPPAPSGVVPSKPGISPAGHLGSAAARDREEMREAASGGGKR
jgi:hypothetical protein